MTDASRPADVVDRVAALQADLALRNGAPRRAFHAKTITGVAGHLIVSDNVPADLRAGLFARPARYAAVVRFSSGQSWEQPDWMPDIRGMAVRVCGPPERAEGPHLRQDFLAVNGNVRFARDVAEFARLMPLMQSAATVPLHVGRSIGFRQAAALGRDFAGIAGRTLACLSGQSFFCVAPVAVGSGAAKIAFRSRRRRRRRSPLFARDGLRESVDIWLEETDLEWDLILQPYRDDRLTPLDDLSVRWSERDAPAVTVAALVLTRRNREAARLQRAEVEPIAFSPWNALAEHRPLGSIQALRRPAYEVSAAARRAEHDDPRPAPGRSPT